MIAVIIAATGVGIGVVACMVTIKVMSKLLDWSCKK